ncbi:type I restriction enzyme M protein [Nocardiopsis mwathae]|uniref:Type I restriction enzyme M protein n=1 Tax=Nocardiopsis mwathae TaxID=1472723 RepID=A0A7W9YLS8_9ACTN|nr:type I restriction enzyme M protein [Nocardiopsis mwathae]
MAPHVRRLVQGLSNPLNEHDAWRIVVSLVYGRWAAQQDDGRESPRPTWSWLVAVAEREPRVGPRVREFLDHWLPRDAAPNTPDAGQADVPSLHPTVDNELRGLISTINRADRLDDLFEHCLRELSDSQAKGGHYFTPRDIARLMVEAVQPRDAHRICDPVCGSAGLLIEAVRYLRRHTSLDVRARLTGQDLHAGTLQIAQMNLEAHGVKADLAPPMDSLAEPMTEPFDIVLANPPFNMPSWTADAPNPHDPRWSDHVPPPRGDANFAWLLHIVHGLAPHGRAAVLMPDGAATNRRKADQSIREGLVRDDLVECVVALPPGLFPHVRIPCCLWLLNRDKSPQGRGGTDRRGEVLFINARKVSEQIGTSRRWRLERDGTQRILHTLAAWRGAPRFADVDGAEGYQDQPGWCRSRSLHELVDGHCDLLPPNHAVDPSDTGADSRQRIAQIRWELYKKLEEAWNLDIELRRALDEL